MTTDDSELIPHTQIALTELTDAIQAQVEKNKALIKKTVSAGKDPTLLYLLSGVEALKRAVSPDQAGYLALNLLHEELFEAQLGMLEPTSGLTIVGGME